MKSPFVIRDVDSKRVLDYFYRNNDNRITVIANALYLHKAYVDFIIDLDLSKKRNFSGSSVPQPRQDYHKNSKPVKAFDEFGVEVGTFRTIFDCSKALNISPYYLSRKLLNNKKTTIKHYEIHAI